MEYSKYISKLFIVIILYGMGNSLLIEYNNNLCETKNLILQALKKIIITYDWTQGYIHTDGKLKRCEFNFFSSLFELTSQCETLMYVTKMPEEENIMYNKSEYWSFVYIGQPHLDIKSGSKLQQNAKIWYINTALVRWNESRNPDEVLMQSEQNYLNKFLEEPEENEVDVTENYYQSSVNLYVAFGYQFSGSNDQVNGVVRIYKYQRSLEKTRFFPYMKNKTWFSFEVPTTKLVYSGSGENCDEESEENKGFQSLEGTTLKVATMPDYSWETPPGTLGTTGWNETNLPFQDRSIGMLTDLQKLLKFKMDIIIPVTYREIIRLIEIGDVDMGFGNLMATPSRRAFIDFSIPIRPVHWVCCYHQSALNIPLRMIYTSPFQQSFWFIIPALYLCIALCLNITHKMVYKEVTAAGNQVKILKPGEENTDEKSWNWCNSGLCAFGSFCLQSWKATPPFLGSRIAFASGFFLSVVLQATHSGLLTSSLATAPKEFDDFDDILASSNIKTVTVPRGITRYWSEVLNETYKNYHDYLKKAKYIQLLSEGLLTLKEEEATITQKHFADYILANNIPREKSCKITCLQLKVPENYEAAAFQKRSKYIKLINNGLSALKEAGTWHRLDQIYGSTNAILTCTKQREVLEATITDVASAFIILVTGIVAAILTVTLELGVKFAFSVYSRYVN